VEVPFEGLMQHVATEPEAWRAKRHWHEHINFFTSDALHLLLEAAGLQVLCAREIHLSEKRTQFGFVCGLSST
jgi:hypothetical protein